MKYQAPKRLVLAGLLAVTGIAQATTVTFDSLANPDVYRFTTDTYAELGYSFAATWPTGGYSLYAWGAASGLDADPTGATLSLGHEYDGHAITASRTLGGTFTLGSFDLSNRYDDASGGVIRFDYVDAQGTHTGELTLANQAGLQTFAFGYTGLTSFTLWDTHYQLDNVVVTAEASVVPEPASCLLLVSGLALLARRRKA